MADPSVTEVVGVFTDWSKIPASVLEIAAARGTDVHRICGVIARGLPYLGQITEDRAGYIMSFQSWLSVAVERVYFVERRLRHPTLPYHGQPDLCVLMKGDHYPSVPDLKTPATKHPSWCGQMAGYKELVNSQWQALGLPGPAKRAFSVRLDRNGGAAKIDPYDDDARDWQAFLCALTAFRYFRGK